MAPTQARRWWWGRVVPLDEQLLLAQEVEHGGRHVLAPRGRRKPWRTSEGRAGGSPHASKSLQSSDASVDLHKRLRVRLPWRGVADVVPKDFAKELGRQVEEMVDRVRLHLRLRLRTHERRFLIVVGAGFFGSMAARTDRGQSEVGGGGGLDRLLAVARLVPKRIVEPRGRLVLHIVARTLEQPVRCAQKPVRVGPLQDLEMATLARHW